MVMLIGEERLVAVYLLLLEVARRTASLQVGKAWRHLPPPWSRRSSSPTQAMTKVRNTHHHTLLPQKRGRASLAHWIYVSEFSVNVMTRNNGAHQGSPYDPGIQKRPIFFLQIPEFFYLLWSSWCSLQNGNGNWAAYLEFSKSIVLMLFVF